MSPASATPGRTPPVVPPPDDVTTLSHTGGAPVDVSGFASSGNSPPERLLSAGWDIVPVIPPDAALSPRSRVSPEARGKTPGLKTSAGWVGLNINRPGWAPTVEDAARWASWKANLGLKATRFPGVDIDIDDATISRTVMKMAQDILGVGPVRLSRGERRLLVYRADEPFTRMALSIMWQGQTHLLEVLGEGRQFVIWGNHPSGSKYRFEGPPLWDVDPTSLPLVTRDSVSAFLDAVKERLERVPGMVVTRKGTGEAAKEKGPPPEWLKAPSLEQLYALPVPPNPPEWGYEDWIKVGYAIAAASADDPDYGFDLWDRFSAQHAAYDPDETELYWQRGFSGDRVGWSYLQDLARGVRSEHWPNGYNPAQDEFTAYDVPPPAEAPSPSPEAPPTASGLPAAVRLIDLPKPKPIRFVCKPLVQARELSIWAGDGGSMKTTLALAMSAAVAGGYDAFGMYPTTSGPVFILSEEDDADVVSNRIEAICEGHGWDRAKVFSNIHVIAQAGASIEDKAWREHLAAEVKRTGAVLLVADNLAQLMRGEESKDAAAKAVVRAFGRLISDTGAAVILIHHSGKRSEGKRKIDQAVRGSSVFYGAARAVFVVEKDEFFVGLECLKYNRLKKLDPLAVAFSITEAEEGTWRSARFTSTPMTDAAKVRADAWLLDLIEAAELNSSGLKEAAQGTGISGQEVSAAIKRNRQLGLIDFTEGARGSRIWHLTEAGRQARAGVGDITYPGEIFPPDPSAVEDEVVL